MRQIHVKLLRKQREFKQCQKKWAAARGGVGSGKTVGMAWWMLERIVGYPRATHAVVGADYEQLRRGFFGSSLLGILEGELGWEAGTDFKYRDDPSPRLTLLGSGAQLRSMSAEVAQRVRSIEIQTLYCEEPQTWHNGNGESTFRTISDRLRPSISSSRFYPNLQPMGRMTFNTSGPAGHVGSWLYELIEKTWQKPEYGYPCWRFSLRENVLFAGGDLEKLADYIRSVEMRPMSQWPSEIEGEWRVDGGYFFDGSDINTAIDDDLQIYSVKSDAEGRESEVLVGKDGKPWLEVYPSHRYIHGWDLGDRLDYTVGTTWDVDREPYRLVHFERFNNLGWNTVINKIRARSSHYSNSDTHVDATGVGAAVLDQLKDIGAIGEVFTKPKKDAMLGDIQVMLSQQMLRVPRIQQWINEMRWYQRDDKDIKETDCVMSTAVAGVGMKRGSGGFYFAEV